MTTTASSYIICDVGYIVFRHDKECDILNHMRCIICKHQPKTCVFRKVICTQNKLLIFCILSTLKIISSASDHQYHHHDDDDDDGDDDDHHHHHHEKMFAGMRPPLVMIFRPFALLCRDQFPDQALICPTSKSLHPFTAKCAVHFLVNGCTLYFEKCAQLSAYPTVHNLKCI